MATSRSLSSPAAGVVDAVSSVPLAVWPHDVDAETRASVARGRRHERISGSVATRIIGEYSRPGQLVFDATSHLDCALTAARLDRHVIAVTARDSPARLLLAQCEQHLTPAQQHHVEIITTRADAHR